VSIVGQLLGGAIGAVTGFAKGGFIGAGVGAVTGFAGGGGGGGPGTSVVPYQPPGGGGGIFGNQTMPFGLPTVGQVTGTGWGSPAPGGTCPKGYHLNRKPLAASKRHGVVAAGTMCVRNRHINPLNARAITRSLRRVKRARKLVAKLHSFAPARRLGSGGHKPGCGCFRCRKR